VKFYHKNVGRSKQKYPDGGRWSFGSRQIWEGSYRKLYPFRNLEKIRSDRQIGIDDVGGTCRGRRGPWRLGRLGSRPGVAWSSARTVAVGKVAVLTWGYAIVGEDGGGRKLRKIRSNQYIRIVMSVVLAVVDGRSPAGGLTSRPGATQSTATAVDRVTSGGIATVSTA